MAASSWAKMPPWLWCSVWVGLLQNNGSRTDLLRGVDFGFGKGGGEPECHHLLVGGFDGEGGETHYRNALALAEPRGMRPLVAHCHLGLGKLYRRTGKREPAQEHLRTATTMYREMGMTYWLATAEAELGESA